MKILLLISFFLPYYLIAQNTISISGQFKDANKTPLNFLEVVIMHNDSLVIADVTDEDGKFKFNLQKGAYKLLANNFGENIYEKDIELSKSIDLGILAIDRNIQLGGVVITARKPLIERNVNRLVFNVANSISAIGGDAIDALKVTPGLRLKDDQISVIGKSGVAVMVDDRIMPLSGEDLINFLKTIKSDDIKSIEVITNPPAKYSAEGNSGLVNINLKKLKSDSWGAIIRLNYTQAKYALGGSGISLNYKKNKLTFKSGITYNDGSHSNEETQTIFYPTQTSNSKTTTQQFRNILSYTLGVDYKLTTKISLGILYLGSYSEPINKSVNNNLFVNSNSNQVDQIFKTSLDNSTLNNNNSINFHTLYEIDTLGRTLNLDIDYFNFKKSDFQDFITQENNLLDNTYSETYINNNGDQDRENFSLKIDIEHPLSFINLNYGGRLSATNTFNDIEYFDLSSGTPIFDSSNSNKFNYKENNQALYMSINKMFLDGKWEAQIGLRMESTQTEGNSITLNQITKKSYTKLFPTTYITYIPNDNHSFSINYGKRINRPKYNWVNPFRIYYSSYSFYEGNPNLEPSYSHNIELSYTLKGNLNSTLYYSNENNGFDVITIINPDSINIKRSFFNHYTQYDYGLIESYTFSKYKWLESYFSGSIYYTKAISDNPNTNKLTQGWGLIFLTVIVFS